LDGPELVSYLSLEAGSLYPTPNSGGRGIKLSVLLSVGDPTTASRTQLDTTIAYLSATPFAGDAVIHWTLPMRTPAAENARVTITIENQADTTQGLVLATTWRVPAFAGTMLVSDLVVGEVRPGSMRRGTHAIAAVPGHSVPRNGRFRLYYEVYGARTADQLVVNIGVVPTGDGPACAAVIQPQRSRQGARPNSEAPAGTRQEGRTGSRGLSSILTAMPDADGVLRSERELLADLATGAYDLVVTVRNARTGEAASAGTNLIVMAR
jgi:hypothetical protein